MSAAAMSIPVSAPTFVSGISMSAAPMSALSMAAVFMAFVMGTGNVRIIGKASRQQSVYCLIG